MHEIKIFTDGSYRHKTKDGSYSYLILVDDYIAHQFSRTTFDVKSNCLEFMAIKYAIKNVFKNYLKNIIDVVSIDVYTDSKNCINYIQNKCQTHNKYLKEIKEDLDNILETIDRNYNIKVNFHHVKGHNTNKLNNIVDKIATMISEYNKDIRLKKG